MVRMGGQARRVTAVRAVTTSRSVAVCRSCTSSMCHVGGRLRLSRHERRLVL